MITQCHAPRILHVTLALVASLAAYGCGSSLTEDEAAFLGTYRGTQIVMSSDGSISNTMSGIAKEVIETSTGIAYVDSPSCHIELTVTGPGSATVVPITCNDLMVTGSAQLSDGDALSVTLEMVHANGAIVDASFEGTRE